MESCDSLDYGHPPRCLCPWDSPGRNTGMCCHALLPGIFPTQWSNPGLLTSPALAGGFFITRATWDWEKTTSHTIGTKLTTIFYFLLEKGMATYSSTLAWKIPWAEEPVKLQCMGLQRVGHDWMTSLPFLFPYCFSCILRKLQTFLQLS